MFSYEQCKDNYHSNINPLGSIFKTLKLPLNFNYKINNFTNSMIKTLTGLLNTI